MIGKLVGPRSRWLIGITLVAVLAVGGWWIFGSARGDEGALWVEVERDDLVLTVEVEGTLRAVESSQLGPPQVREFWDFKVAHMATEGEDVNKGDPVLSFDTSALQQQLIRQQAEADQSKKQIEKTRKNLSMTRRQDELRLAEAEARLRKARLKVDAPGELSKAKELAEARLDLELAEKEVAYLRARFASSQESAEAQLATLRDQRERAEARVQEITQAIENMTRKSPRDGTVIYVENWRGEKKKVGESCWSGEMVIEIPDLTAMMARGSVDESDAGRLAEGQRVELRLDAHPDEEFTGKVSSIWKTVGRKSWRTPQKVAQLEIQLDQTDTQRMRPGMRFRGTVETERIAGALQVPIEAVFLRPDGPRVFRRTLLGHEEVSVELGRRNEDRVEVLVGIEEGDSVSLIDLEAEGERGA